MRRFYAEALPPLCDPREALGMLLSKTGTFIAEEAIRLHGGIGMTWALAMTHFAKPLVMINHQLADEDHHPARYVKLGRSE